MEPWSSPRPNHHSGHSRENRYHAEEDDRYQHQQSSGISRNDEPAETIRAAQQGLLVSPSHRARTALGLNEYTLSRLWYKVGKEVERYIKKTGQQPTEAQVRAWAIQSDVLGTRREALLASPSEATTDLHEALRWITQEGLADLFDKNRVQLPSTPDVPTTPPEGFPETEQHDTAGQGRSTDNPPVKEAFSRSTARIILGMKEPALYNDFRDYCFHIATVRRLEGRTRGWLAWQVEEVKAEILKLALPEHIRALMVVGRHTGNERLWEAFDFLWKAVIWDLGTRKQKHRNMPGVGKREDFLAQYPDPDPDDSEEIPSIPDTRGTRRSNRVRGIRAVHSHSTGFGDQEYQPGADSSSLEAQSTTPDEDAEQTPVPARSEIQRTRRQHMEVRSAPAKMGSKRKSTTPPTEAERRRKRPATRFVSPPSPTGSMIESSSSRFRKIASTTTGSTPAQTTQPARAAKSAPAKAPGRPTNDNQDRPFQRRTEKDDQSTGAQRDRDTRPASHSFRNNKNRHSRDPSLPHDPAPYRFPETVHEEKSRFKHSCQETSPSIAKTEHHQRGITPSLTEIEAAVNWAMLDKSAAAMWCVLDTKQQEELRKDLAKAYVDKIGSLWNGESRDIAHEALAAMVRARTEVVRRENETKEWRKYC